MKEVFEIVEGPHALRNELWNREKFTLLGMALKQHLLVVLESGTVKPVTLSNLNPMSFSSQRSNIGFLKTAFGNSAKNSSNESAT